MELRYFVVDAFASRVFAGNPAAVVPLERWLPDATLQSIAAENNLAETAFFFREGERYHLRWMTPLVEVELCGHATLASGFVALEFLGVKDRVDFLTQSGPLFVKRAGERLEMDLPVHTVARHADVPAVGQALGAKPIELHTARDWIAVFETEEQVRALAPDMGKVLALRRGHGVIATAPGRGCDFVSRYFAPAVGIPEDPVTGSAHCALTPLWSQKLGKRALEARQISKRGGELFCELRGDRVALQGRAVRYAEGTLFVP